MARLLILTLNSGETALPVMLRQLRSQSFQDFEHEIISGLPNRAAHDRLYQTIMERSASFELFLKLDADMTFRSETALAEAVGAANQHPDAGHVAFSVWDYFTEEETLGVHVFRSGVTWHPLTDDLFVDPDPPGVRQLLWKGPPAPFVNHGEVASEFECFCFGVHKFLKMSQRGRVDGWKAHKFDRHMQNCARIRDLYRRTRARRHQLALMGVLWAMDHANVSTMTSKAELQCEFAKEIPRYEASWSRRVDRLSTSLFVWRFSLYRTLGLRRAFA